MQRWRRLRARTCGSQLRWSPANSWTKRTGSPLPASSTWSRTPSSVRMLAMARWSPLGARASPGSWHDGGVDAPHGVASEVDPLRTVMLHRPGPELGRLTPRNNDELLFDGVPWLARAQEEHDAFAGVLRSRGVEVLYVTALLAEVLDLPAARAQLLDRALRPQS